VYSIRSDRPLDPPVVDLLKTIDHVMKTRNQPYFIVGATARDLLLTHVFGLETGRATRDLDIGITVTNWAEFEETRTGFVQTAGFDPDAKVIHRLHKGGYPLDIIPFDGVESPDHTIAWPPDLTTAMNVSGYHDAFQAAVTVPVGPGIDIRIVSLPGLAVLKLFAWADRGLRDSRDATDLATLLRTYHQAGNHDRLYGAEFDVLEGVDYKVEMAGAVLLGRDVRRISQAATLSAASERLADAASRVRLVSHMARAWGFSDDGESRADELLTHFRKGLTDD
jgi:predicted nucleotidyltransferase